MVAEQIPRGLAGGFFGETFTLLMFHATMPQEFRYGIVRVVGAWPL